MDEDLKQTILELHKLVDDLISKVNYQEDRIDELENTTERLQDNIWDLEDQLAASKKEI